MLGGWDRLHFWSARVPLWFWHMLVTVARISRYGSECEIVAVILQRKKQVWRPSAHPDPIHVICAGIPHGSVKCFKAGMPYGIWLQPSHLRTRKELAAVLRQQFGPTLGASTSGQELHVIFVDRDDSYHTFDMRTEGKSEQPFPVEPEKSWGRISQRAALVLVE